MYLHNERAAFNISMTHNVPEHKRESSHYWPSERFRKIQVVVSHKKLHNLIFLGYIYTAFKPGN